MKLVPVTELPTTRVGPDDDRPEVGSWWWVKSGKLKGLSKDEPEDEDEDSEEEVTDRNRYDKPGKLWLACVVEVGSNYAKVKGVRLSWRIALDDFHQRCKAEPAPESFINERVAVHKGHARELMGEIKQICHRLGVPMRQALTSASEAPALALALVHSTANVDEYKDALTKAKEQTLPELFKKVQEQHKEMAVWMKAELIPAEAELSAAEGVTQTIASKIHTVELYAGLTEDLVQVREGDSAPIDEKVRLMQRRHYMDEECLIRYQAGGMDFENLEDFDKWISREENFKRILPHKRCVVAMRVRRFTRDYGTNIAAFIKFAYDQNNKKTYLYIRNGEQLWRTSTSIEFGDQLFPNKEDSDLLGSDELWVKDSEYDIERGNGLISGRQRNAMIEYWKAKLAFLSRKLTQWKAAGESNKAWTYIAQEGDAEVEYSSWTPGTTHHMNGRPGEFPFDSMDTNNPVSNYQRLEPTNIFYDDAMARIQKAAYEHNQVAVVMQGLLDRSVCLHPHPPWKIWTPEGFTLGIELVYDVSKAITPGEAPDWEGYRKQLNKSIRTGCYTIGQEAAWEAFMENKYGGKWRHGANWQNNGPDLIHRVAKVKRNGDCEFEWTKGRANAKWIPDPESPGYLKAVRPPINTGWTCPAECLTCVDAYTPGDFHIFFDDPRTREDYLEWAPVLLACEDWHHARRLAQSESK